MSVAGSGAIAPLPGQYLPDYKNARENQRAFEALLQDIQDNFEAQGRTFSGAQGVASPTFLNSWVDYGAPYTSTSLWKQNDGTVHLEGVLKKAGVYAAEAILNVPAGFRPPAGLIFLVAYASSTPTYGHMRVEVATSGDLSLVAGSLGAVGIGHVSVCGLTWRAA